MVSVVEQLIRMAKCIPPVHDGSCDCRSRPEIFTDRNAGESEDTERQIGECYLLLKRVPRRPADAGGDLVGSKGVPRKSEYAAGTNRDGKPI